MVTATRELKLKVMNRYSGDPPSCACCGVFDIEFLSINRIGGGGCQHFRDIGQMTGQRGGGGGKFYRWLINNGYPPGYRVLCMNCNFSVGHFGYCPHHNLADEVMTG